MRKILKKILLSVLVLIVIFLGYLFIGKPKQAEKITWGINFSQEHAQKMGLNWQEAYLAMMNDLGAKNIKLSTNWNLIEPREGVYDFRDLDWQIKEAEQNNSNLLLVIGMKTPRWPECHIPDWAAKLDKEQQQKKILDLIKTIVLRYRNSNAIGTWQVENEPFFPFGECPWISGKNFLKTEIALVKSLDSQKRPVLISDSGEASFWIRAGSLGDIVGITMYKTVWMSPLNMYIDYPFPAIFYWRKALLVKELFHKEVIVGELQAEPWGPTVLYLSPLSEQEKTMNVAKFRKNIQFAESTGFNKFYLWGAEWWYWMKEKQGKPEIWNEAKKLF